MSIIVTVCDEKKSFMFDLEVPVMQSVDTLSLDIAEALKGLKITLKTNKPIFFVPRLKRTLNAHETLGQAGVWNGDYLIIVNNG